MTKQSIYDLQEGVADPVEELVKALTAVNFHAKRCGLAGWGTAFSIGPSNASVDVVISRVGPWPTELQEKAP